MIPEIAWLLGLVHDASSMIEVKSGTKRPGRGNGGALDDDWQRAIFSVSEMRLGSLELLIVASSAALGAWKGLPALLTFLQGLRDWTLEKRIKESEARRAEAEARLAELKTDEAVRAAERRADDFRKPPESVPEFLREINLALTDPDVRIVPLTRRVYVRREGDPSGPRDESERILLLAEEIEAVAPEW
jgi:hypothetical protein